MGGSCVWRRSNRHYSAVRQRHCPSAGAFGIAENKACPPTCDTEKLCFIQRGAGAKGLERRGTYRLDLGSLFADWAGVVRELGKVPTLAEYEIHAKYSCRPLLRHYGGWGHVPGGMLEYARG